MDPLAHEFPLNRKRKADEDDRPQKRQKKPIPPPRRLLRRRSPTHHRLGNDIEDIGIVSHADPGPSSGSLLRLRDTTSPSSIPIDPNSAHIPPLLPPINRSTLAELDLEVIIRNPQLRHDLLFDPGLQFRPTTTDRKTGRAERYWAAITCELDSGCTCVSFDVRGKPHATICACAHVSIPSANPVVACFFLVIQPLSNIAGAQLSPSKSQQAEHSAQAAYIRSVFDPALIQQELKHKLFDPSGLFRAIGPVELMVQVAQTCAPGGQGSKADAVKAPMLILLLQDIANHQLQTLRPFLIRTSGQFELRSFRNRKSCSFQNTREWLGAAHSALLDRKDPIPHPLYPSTYLRYQSLQRNQQIYLATLKGLTDLVFTSPSPAHLAPLPVATTPLSQATLPTISSLPGYPETAYLDNARLLLLSTDAADLTALYMFLLLYRQLRFSGSTKSPSPSPRSTVDEWEVVRIKREIRDIGSSRLGYSFHCEVEKWRSMKQNVVLQIAMRARNVSPEPSAIPGVVDQSILGVAEQWADANMQHNSPLSILLRERLRDTVFNAVVANAYPGRDAASGKLANIDFSTFGRTSTPLANPTLGKVAGMEAISEEIGTLAEHISRLALIHLNAYIPLYEVLDAHS
ncbi:T-complex protein 11-domain-containing protein [Roridomyces roridus]|uniref:T-complex protein 11-domain-containing protein n=1 Tax=Roridomyces roridus TaxID=1738132 RepID=A0AAD7CBF1_9AGAR|nr:T-complex protein 11-domain-containing protein [Roridomyces roridus]